MREIKFRAWNKSQNKMEEIDWWWQEGSDITLNEAFERWQNDGLKIMQYTGLKDKNGKEIYEGDILQRNGYTWGMLDKESGKLIPHVISSENILMKYQKIVVAKFEISPQSCVFLLPKDENYAERTHPATYEIIGNIYENPELITPEK